MMSRLQRLQTHSTLIIASLAKKVNVQLLGGKFSASKISNVIREVKLSKFLITKRGFIHEPPKPPFDTNALGHKVLGVSSTVGIAALCYYGFIETTKASATSRHLVWQDYTRWRLQRTFGYFGASAIITFFTTAAVFKSRKFLKLLYKSPPRFFFSSLAFQVVTGLTVLNTPYSVNQWVTLKEVAWVVHSAMLGVTLAPFCLVGGTLVIKAFSITGTVVIALSTLAFCAPEKIFLSWSLPLGVGLGIIFASSIGAFIIPQTTSLGITLFSIYCYGGILLFSLMLLYDMQRVVMQAELQPLDERGDNYDPINAAMSLYVDGLNLFVRIIQHLALQQFGKGTK